MHLHREMKNVLDCQPQDIKKSFSNKANNTTEGYAWNLSIRERISKNANMKVFKRKPGSTNILRLIFDENGGGKKIKFLSKYFHTTRSAISHKSEKLLIAIIFRLMCAFPDSRSTKPLSLFHLCNTLAVHGFSIAHKQFIKFQYQNNTRSTKIKLNNYAFRNPHLCP